MFDNTRYARKDLDFGEMELREGKEVCVIGASLFVETHVQGMPVK
jgi:hypothetical protein